MTESETIARLVAVVDKLLEATSRTKAGRVTIYTQAWKAAEDEARELLVAVRQEITYWAQRNQAEADADAAADDDVWPCECAQFVPHASAPTCLTCGGLRHD